MSIDITKLNILSKHQFTQEFLPTMHPEGRYLTLEEVTAAQVASIVLRKTWAITTQDDGSPIAFPFSFEGYPGAIQGYVLCQESTENESLAAKWWDSKEEANTEILKWARYILDCNPDTTGETTKAWAREVLDGTPIDAEEEPAQGWATKILDDAFGPLPTAQTEQEALAPFYLAGEVEDLGSEVASLRDDVVTLHSRVIALENGRRKDRKRIRRLEKEVARLVEVSMFQLEINRLGGRTMDAMGTSIDLIVDRLQ